MSNPNLQEIFEELSKIKVEQNAEMQSILNIENKTRTSLFPWRGQFSPQLVEYLLSQYAHPKSYILDPFCGSGTTLYEAARKKLKFYGSDINPAAYLFSSIVKFSSISPKQRQNIINTIRQMAARNINYFHDCELFEHLDNSNQYFEQQLKMYYQESQQSFWTNLAVTTTTLLAMGDAEQTTRNNFFKCLNLVINIIQGLPYCENNHSITLADSRFLELPNSCIDLVITSPPYINVFNYHQNYRKALEFLGWNPLQVAISEIGANRKHRSNRFLTVIQYCMDMSQAFLEMRRVLSHQGKLIIVIGRTSTVRGISFQNANLLAMIAISCAGLSIEDLQHRYFINRFGQKIHEDIFTFSVQREWNGNYLEIARSISIWALENALEQARGEVKHDIEQALINAFSVQASPKFNLQNLSIPHCLFELTPINDLETVSLT